jgi:chromosomal replication initiator protein
MYLMREEIGASFPQIGQALNRDHTTVMHGIGRVADDLDKDADLTRTISSLRNKLYEPVRVR